MKILEIENITKTFGGLTAVDNVSFTVEKGNIHALIGPNGAGKTTLFNVINGFFNADSGKVNFNGKNITGFVPSKVSKLGLGRTFQIVKVFKEMTIEENVLAGLGMKVYDTSKVFFQKTSSSELIERADIILDKCELKEHKDKLAGQVSIGIQRKVEIARSLATEPKLLLLDEPASGLNSYETKELIKLIKRLNSEEITVLFVEHDMEFTMNIARTVTVLDYGVKIAEGKPKEISENKKVIEAYLGSDSIA